MKQQISDSLEDAICYRYWSTQVVKDFATSIGDNSFDAMLFGA